MVGAAEGLVVGAAAGLVVEGSGASGRFTGRGRTGPDGVLDVRVTGFADALDAAALLAAVSFAGEPGRKGSWEELSGGAERVGEGTVDEVVAPADDEDTVPFYTGVSERAKTILFGDTPIFATYSPFLSAGARAARRPDRSA